ncbi:protein ORF28A [Cyprinid herpesvirus 1]|uniref:Protein ORF28A n=1 Tax=Cyprinid herpesvirus 1 TaxID=317858 RepID=K7PBC4_9VIRU|nr:protein ORF28A [Cyprinid herpesvirus 1]AFJ20334.1 protein ORF28A [Cyprinid herpesvirus 1]
MTLLRIMVQLSAAAFLLLAPTTHAQVRQEMVLATACLGSYVRLECVLLTGLPPNMYVHWFKKTNKDLTETVATRSNGVTMTNPAFNNMNPDIDQSGALYLRVHQATNQGFYSCETLPAYPEVKTVLHLLRVKPTCWLK